MVKQKKFLGFTLLELLVAMAILGILATVILVSSQSALRRGRDAARKSDLAQVANALELFYQDHGFYPPEASGNLIRGCPYVLAGGTSCVWGTGTFEDSAGDVYMSPLPGDPDSARYRYIYDVSPTGDRFKLFAFLENPEDENINASAVSQNQTCTVTGVSPSQRCNYAVTSSDTLVTDSF